VSGSIGCKGASAGGGRVIRGLRTPFVHNRCETSDAVPLRGASADPGPLAPWQASRMRPCAFTLNKTSHTPLSSKGRGQTPAAPRGQVFWAHLDRSRPHRGFRQRDGHFIPIQRAYRP
jgi:hypothetical protein